MSMAELIQGATRIPVPGGKVIDEYVGRVNSGEAGVSVAHMVAPGGWVEPAQQPGFDEITLVLRGCVRVEHSAGVFDVRAGQAVVTRAGERVRYTTPDDAGAEYVAICLPAFSPDLVNRELE
jgi:mannose-6-phosphate isomerase-like protein (cupin superfamily)